MKILVAGASGAIGRRLVPLLRDSGYQVTGTTRTKKGAERLHALGAETAIVDVFDAGALSEVLLAARPGIVIHQLTGLSALREGRIDEAIVQNARVRTQGTRNLVRAALAANVRKLIAQSIAWIYAAGPLPHSEADPLHTASEGASAVTVRGVIALENAVLKSPLLEGLVLRYGRLYGPGTGRDEPAGAPSVHVDAAAHAALLAVERGAPSSVFNIAEPNELVSTEKARLELGWTDGFRSTL